MPQRKRQPGKLDDVVALLGPLPWAADRVKSEALVALEVLGTEPPRDICGNNLAVRGIEEAGLEKLAAAGVMAWVQGGQPTTGNRSTTSGRQRAHLEGQEIALNLLRAQEGDPDLTDQELERVKTFVLWGLEAYGFSEPEPMRPRGRPAIGSAVREVKLALAQRYREIARGQISVKKVIRQLAENEVLGAKRRYEQKVRRRDCRSVALTEQDDAFVHSVANCYETAYYRSSRITDDEIRYYRRFWADWCRACRSHFRISK
jgi:hypothetical protein